MAFGMTAATPIVTLCEKQPDVFSKDKDGNIDWIATVKRVPQPDFWDEVATVAGAQVQGAVDSGIPGSISYGFVSGFCAGYALKQAGRVAAVVLGMGFVGMQALAYNGYIQVDHGKLKKDVEGLMDLNDDGKIDAADRSIASEKLMEVLQYNMPSGGGFAVGFLGGLRSG